MAQSSCRDLNALVRKPQPSFRPFLWVAWGRQDVTGKGLGPRNFRLQNVDDFTLESTPNHLVSTESMMRHVDLSVQVPYDESYQIQ